MTKKELKNLEKLPLMVAKINILNNLIEQLNTNWPGWYKSVIKKKGKWYNFISGTINYEGEKIYNRYQQIINTKI